VILIDTNLLLYAHVKTFPQHIKAREWLNSTLSGTALVGFPWMSLLGFLGIITNPRVFERPEPMNTAWNQVTEWLDCKIVWIPQPTERHREVLQSLLSLPGIHGNLVPDAHLAALAIEHELTLCSTDRDFARFPHLLWRNPLNR